MIKINNYLISYPYIYPVCPLSIDHAKIMLIADIHARLARKEGKNVCFPIATHYSGVTAEKSINNLNSNDDNIKKKELDKFITNYKTPRNVVFNFKDPTQLLDYYSAQTIYDLKRLSISCDYDNYYKTTEKDYEQFITTIFDIYDSKGLLIKNKNNFLALNYDDKLWRENTFSYLLNLNIIHKSQKNNIISSFDNIKSDWGILRNYGIGIKYKDNYVIDPMFDSELFFIYDLYKKFSKSININNSKYIFEEIFKSLNNENYISNNIIVKEILNFLPINIFICEEHLKNWIIKKTYAENVLLLDKYKTKNYFISGMGYIKGKRMSSSRGTAVLLKDLLDKYGTNITRMIIMFTGGHPSKMYNYNVDNTKAINEMLDNFYNYINYINAQLIDYQDNDIKYMSNFDYLNNLLHEGYYQQTLVEIMKIIPKTCYNCTKEELYKMKNTIKYFLEVLLPDIKI